jgi:hypothetical protein
VGNEVWNRTYGGNGRDWGYAIIPTADGGFVFTGGTDVSLNAAHILDIGVYKTDAHGNLEWERLYNRPVGLQHWDEGYNIRLTADGGYLISGIAHTTVAGGWSETGGGDGWLIKTDAEGRKEWDRVVGGDATDMFVAALPTDDGGYIVSGSTFSFSQGGCRAWLMKTDAVGDDEWDIILAESESGPALLGHNIQLTADGGYLMVCATSTYGAGSWDIWLVKVIDPALQLEMQEGSGLAVLITNTGNAPLFNLTWTVEIEMTGVLTSEQNLQGTIASLASGEVATLQFAPFGLGRATIRVTVDGVGKTATYMMIGPFLLAS